MTRESETARRQRTALSRELRDFLIQLSIAIHRYGMYPDGHPSLQPMVENVLSLLGDVLATRTTLSIGVARNQLVIEGVATDPKNAVLLELASRMHRHHLGAVTFRRGAKHAELHEFLQQVAQDPDRTGQPMGLDPRLRSEIWPNVRPYPLNYERLQFAPDDPASLEETDQTRAVRTRAAQLWIGLARAALAHGAETDDRDIPDVELDALEDTDPTAVASAIAAHERTTAYDQVIVGYMLQIADELKSGQTPESSALRRRVSKLVSSLDRGSLGRLLQMGGSLGQRHQFLLNAAEGMALEAVLDLVQAAASAERQTISHSLLRMLQKLARHADVGRGKRQSAADSSVREQVMNLIRDWALHDPNPDGYRTALQRMSAAVPVFAVPHEARYLPEARRVFEMALELDVAGEPVERAVEELLDKGELKWMLETLNAAYAPNAAAALRGRVATPAQIEQVLAQEPLNQPLLDELLGHVGAAAAGPLLDALIGAENRQTRRVLIDRIIRLGPDVAPAVIARLSDKRWYVTRNMITLLGEMPQLPPGFDPMDFVTHADGRVRREALRILLRDEATRDRAISVGLADADDHCVRLALTVAGRGVSEAAIPLLVARATTGSNSDQRCAAIKVLAATRHAAALDALLQIAAPRRTLLGAKTPPKSKEYLTALAALGGFADEPRAREALAVAGRSRDPEIAQAALGRTREGGGA